MFKPIAITLAASLLFIPAATAQTDEHAGHNHNHQHGEGSHSHDAKPYIGPMSAAPGVEHIFTEAPDDHVIGAADAPTTIISYVSVTCGHCSQWFKEEWPTFKKEQIDTGKARFILREFPTAPVNLAMTGFVMANCAPKEDYFKNIEFQMASQATLIEEARQGRGEEAFAPIAAMAGLNNRSEIIACFEKQEGTARMRRAYQRAQAAGVDAVPSFFVDGAKFTAKASAANLGAVINAKAKGGVSMPDKMPANTSK